MSRCILCGKEAEHGEVCNKCKKDYEIEETYEEGVGGSTKAQTSYGLISAYKSMINKYSQFDGRSRLSEYWNVVLGDFIISLVILSVAFLFILLIWWSLQ